MSQAATGPRTIHDISAQDKPVNIVK